MLSSVAERIYWAARYLERAENTARLIRVYDSLLLDLPRGLNISWYNLVELNSAAASFAERYRVQDERNVVKFLLADADNPISLQASLKWVRENLRTTRDVFAPEVWELVNDLFYFSRDEIAQGLGRKLRHGFCEGIIRGCELVTGQIAATTSRDAAWRFLELGRYLERADMTTRILDAGAVTLLQSPELEGQVNLGQIVWGHVLGSLSAELAFRRRTRMRVGGPEVANFLLEDPDFPRTLRFCRERVAEAVRALPRNKAVLGPLDELAGARYPIASIEDLGQRFRDHLNELQIRIAALHRQIADTWFAVA
ncbi:MAG: alpha-E domain-containing protein [Pseudomonadota bacterium]|jgi:uncharacterized alpha-E superfamily protein